MRTKIIKLFLRLAISIGFLSAVADRFGLWNKDVSVWGNWDNFLNFVNKFCADCDITISAYWGNGRGIKS
mgnify:CR=1 FL=1